MPAVVYPKNIRYWFYSAIYLVCSGCAIASELVWRNESVPWLITVIFWLVVVLFFVGAAYYAYPAAFIFEVNDIYDSKTTWQ
jgi:predicted Abi (CAAX) family protease